jgi:phosphoglycolate phosphatase-like HAD superfamily hydrolase
MSDLETRVATVYDADGFLVDSFPLMTGKLLDRLSEKFPKVKKPTPDDIETARNMSGAEQVLEFLLRDIHDPKERVSVARSVLKEGRKLYYELRDEINPFYQELRDNGSKINVSSFDMVNMTAKKYNADIFIVSSNDERAIKHISDKNGLDYKTIYQSKSGPGVSELYGKHRYLRVLANLYDLVIFFADEPRDYFSSKRSGSNVVFVGGEWGIGTKSALERAGAKYFVKNLSDIPEVVDDIISKQEYYKSNKVKRLARTAEDLGRSFVSIGGYTATFYKIIFNKNHSGKNPSN